MFYSAISKEAFDSVITLLFRNLGLVTPSTTLDVQELTIDHDREEVVIVADVEAEVLN